MNLEARPEQGIEADIIAQDTIYLKRDSTRSRSGRLRKEAANPLGKWIDNVVDLQGITLRDLGASLGSSNISKWRRGLELPDLESISSLLMYAETSELPEDFKEELREAIAESIEERAKRGITIGISPFRNRILQKLAPFVTYTGGQAGDILEETRENIRLMRKTLGIEHQLMTDQDIEKLRELKKERLKRKPKTRRGLGSLKSPVNESAEED